MTTYDTLFAFLPQVIIYVAIPYIYYLHRTLTVLRTDIDTKMNRKDTSELIDLKKEVTDFQYKSLKEDLDAVNSKLDRLIERYVEREDN